MRFELTGGFIKNAVLSALSIAVSRDGDNPVVKQKDFLEGANLQLRGRLRMKDFHRRLIPKHGLDKIVVDEKNVKSLNEIVQFEKARSLINYYHKYYRMHYNLIIRFRSVLFGQWGFSDTDQQVKFMSMCYENLSLSLSLSLSALLCSVLFRVLLFFSMVLLALVSHMLLKLSDMKLVNLSR